MLGAKPYHFTGDLTKVVWARSMNTKAQLSKAIYDSKISMIEVDITMGHKKDGPSAKPIPVIAHPPETVSEFDVDEFFRLVVPLIEDITTPKGFKLDFKSKEAFAGTLPALRMAFSTRKKQFPIWLNGDILSGPGARTGTPIDPNLFITEATKFPQVVISVAWSTLLPSDEPGYSSADIDAMLEILNRYKIAQPVTIPIRAMLIPSSYDDIIRLMRGAKNDTSLTVWCYPTDRPDMKSVKRLLKEVGNKKMYLDMPQNIIDEMGSPVVSTS